MGRKKIAIRPIGTRQGRKVTYNKRRNGLFKKVIEISAMCGVSVRLEMVDPYGNHVVIDAPSKMPARKAKNKPQNICIFGQSDYPQFRGLPETHLPKRRFRRYRRSPSISSDSDETPSSDSLSSLTIQPLKIKKQESELKDTLVEKPREETTSREEQGLNVGQQPIQSMAYVPSMSMYAGPMMGGMGQYGMYGSQVMQPVQLIYFPQPVVLL